MLPLAHHDLRLHPAAGRGGEVVAVSAVDAEVEVEVRRPSSSSSSGDVDPDAGAPGPHAVGHVDHRRVWHRIVVAIVFLVVVVLKRRTRTWHDVFISPEETANSFQTMRYLNIQVDSKR